MIQTKIKRPHRWLAAGLLFGIFLLAVCGLVICGAFRPNRFLVSGDYCRGVDVSHYQGRIDMAALKEAGIEFVYIKATEGSGTVDERYKENSSNARASGLLTGAYHFFSFDSDAETQAAHFISTVGGQSGNLVPMVDVEYYGNKRKNPPEVQETADSLQQCMDILEKEYNRKPVIYTTLSFYGKYIKGRFEEYPLWIRSVYYPAQFCVGDSWTFWQYDDKMVLDAYEGDEKYIDMNVFHGSREEMERRMKL